MGRFLRLLNLISGFLWIFAVQCAQVGSSAYPSTGMATNRNCVLVPVQSSTKFLRLECTVSKLSVDFTNYYNSLSQSEIEQTIEGSLKCSPQPLQSFLEFRQPPMPFPFTKLLRLEIEFCKVPKPSNLLWKNLSLLKSLKVHGNVGSFLLESDVEFDGLNQQLENLDLSHNHILTLTNNPFCSFQNLHALNLSYNQISAFPGKTCPFHVTLQSLDLSNNRFRGLKSNGFFGLERLIELRLQNNNIEEIQDFSFRGLLQLKVLNLSANRIGTGTGQILPTNPFPTTLTELYLQDNSIQTFPNIGQLEHLRVLDLSRNRISNLNDLSSLNDLVVLKLSFNNLSGNLEHSIFKGLSNLQILLLDNNYIDSIHPQIFTTLSNLRTVDLSRNRLSTIDTKLFNQNVALRQLYLDHNKISEIDQNAFKNLKFLQDLGLAGNQFEKIPSAIQSLNSLQTLDLGENNIAQLTNDSFLGLNQLYGLRLVDNKIRALHPNSCNSLTRLRVLNLAQNLITDISATSFTGCPELRALRLDMNKLDTTFPEFLSAELPTLLWLNLSRNSIRRADYRYFPPTVEWLDLSYNSLETLSYEGENVAVAVAVKENYHLRVIDASHNKLTTLNPSSLPPLLETLRVSHNQLTTLTPNTFHNVTHLRRVELMWNKLQSLSESVFLGKSSLEVFLTGNPFSCDCSMEWLQQPSVIRVPDIDSVTCQRQRQNIPIRQAKPEEFLCQYRSHCFALCHCCEFGACDCAMTCPTNCTCSRGSSWTTNIVDCSNLDYNDLPLQIPMDATEINLSGNNFPTLTSHIFIGKKNLRLLYLNGSHVSSVKNRTFNGLRSLEILRLDNNELGRLEGFEFSGLTNLKELYLEHNRLTFISEQTFLELRFLEVLHLHGNQLMDFPAWEFNQNGLLRSLSLASNLWSCDCDFVIRFRNWMTSRSNVVIDFAATAKCTSRNNIKIPMQIINCGGTQGEAAEEEDDRLFNVIENEDHPEKVGNSENLANRHIRDSNTPHTESNLSPLWVLACTIGAFLILGLFFCVLFGKIPWKYWKTWICKTIRDIQIPRCSADSVGAVGGSDKFHEENNDDDGGKLFDAYFLYSQTEEAFVKEKIVAELVPQFRLCLHYRDLCLSSETPVNSDMILSAAGASRRVFVVLSQTFIHSELSNPDFRAALQSAAFRYPRNLHFILIPPLSPTNLGQIYPEYFFGRPNLNSTLDWMDPKFWVKLGQLLPAPETYKSPTIQTSQNFTRCFPPPQIPSNFSPNHHHPIFLPAADENLVYAIRPPLPNHHHNDSFAHYRDFGQSISLISQSKYRSNCNPYLSLQSSIASARNNRNNNIITIPGGSTDDELEHLYSTLDSLQGYPSS